MNWDSIFQTLMNKGHVAVAAVCQGAILFYHWKTGRDIGPNVQSTVFTFYGFLAGHFTSSQVWPDK
jgi:hypothetical protein